MSAFVETDEGGFVNLGLAEHISPSRDGSRHAVYFRDGGGAPRHIDCPADEIARALAKVIPAHPGSRLHVVWYSSPRASLPESHWATRHTMRHYARACETRPPPLRQAFLGSAACRFLTPAAFSRGRV
jgi:hypothetical protein